jgi:YegS/Rv2252/BmrU family lipid kinase
MRQIAMISNPISGRHSAQRRAQLETVAAVLRSEGAELTCYETDGPGSAAALARKASDQGADTVIVCGGDGTLHQALQGLASTQTALGVVPFGTANALAASLGLAGDPVRAARKLLTATPTRLPVGRIAYRNRQGEPRDRYFLVAAGVGPDAQLMVEMDPGLKRRIGYLLYLVDGFRIWAGGRFPLYQVYLDGGEPRQVSQLLVVRVRSFGGAVGALVPGASLHSSKLEMLAFATQSRWEYLRFVVGAALGKHPFSPAVERLEASVVECTPIDGGREQLRAEADGEPLGTLPVRMEIVPAALTLLVPEGVEA